MDNSLFRRPPSPYGEPVSTYPDSADLQRIEEWPLGEPRPLFDFIQSLWAYPEYFTVEKLEDDVFGGWVYRISMSTGGWSGNEDIISSMRKAMGRMFWVLYWYSSQRGGHYVFEVKADRWESS